MKNILVLVCLLLLSTSALSQTRSRTARRGTQAACGFVDTFDPFRHAAE